jgi:(E)-4-hydroxy-3-methylbut-2-enyl-diphosphate synthase
MKKLYNKHKAARCITDEVLVGTVKLGGKHPIRLQSMTSTDTLDTEATVQQCIRIAEAGADFVRITAPTVKAAENFKNIKEALLREGFNIPLTADIHYSPKAAHTAALYADKVRINPGNFADTKKFSHREFSEIEYRAELERIKSIFVPFLNVCKENNCSIRVGVNHGSLSDRIMSRYGDTTKGMVESAMEYLRICREENFTQVVLSMKANNPLVMIEANRLLVKAMHAEGMYFPVHIGVTEAGEGEDGRIKSAIGIANLLADGIGDTIRVSLTEEPEAEIPVAKTLRSLFDLPFVASEDFQAEIINHKPQKRKSMPAGNIGGANKPIVIADFRNSKLNSESIKNAGFSYRASDDDWEKSDCAADCIFYSEGELPDRFPEDTIFARPYGAANENEAVIISYSEFLLQKKLSAKLIFLELLPEEFEHLQAKQIDRENIILLAKIGESQNPLYAGRKIIRNLYENNIDKPLILNLELKDEMNFEIKAAAYVGGLLADYGADGIMFSCEKRYTERYNNTSFGILQAARLRISKPDYISCPSCGRTQFDIQKTAAKVRDKTAHLKGVKIAVMGCIVNGLGEMADADYGYIGAGRGKINLYKNKSLYKKNIPEENAVEELLLLIESDM